ncbi:MAG: hypothetical protein JSV88_04745 [Candidatus Aminicenantes bacterium]|nr:MAG: hypothetical protein JSV88_04745 [Candidatus Aminicenantes bacterium]
MSKDEHDAIPSWFGYVYQGKVALYYALTVINKRLDNGGSFKDYSLEVEWMEDFSIKKRDKYQSIHQVKAYKNSTPGRYKSAIEGIIQKLKKFPNAEGYLHTWKDIGRLLLLSRKKVIDMNFLL